MRPLSRVVVAGLAVGTVVGAASLSPATASAVPSRPTEAAAQTVAVSDAFAHQRAIALDPYAAATRGVAALEAARIARAAAAPHSSRTRADARHRRYPQRRTQAVAVKRESYLQHGRRVYAGLHYDVASLGYALDLQAGREDVLGMTDQRARVIHVYVRQHETDTVLAHTLAHEIGHALDATRNSPASRAHYLSIRGIDSSTYWYGCSSCADYATPAGDWAEAFAFWLAGPGDFRSQLAPAPTAGQLAQLESLFMA